MPKKRLSPNTLLAFQITDHYLDDNKIREDDSCKRLLVALIQRNIMDLFSKIPVERRDALTWLKRRCSEDTAWSFPWVCMHLDFPVDELREQILSKYYRKDGQYKGCSIEKPQKLFTSP